MDADLRELYQEMILDHKSRPRNFRVIEDANHTADGSNPLCGDKIRLYLSVDDDGIVQDASFQGSGCAISTASASMMTEALKGRPSNEVDAMFSTFHALVKGDEPPEGAMELGKLTSLAGVRAFPMRVKCATLCWHTMQAALHESGASVSSE